MRRIKILLVAVVIFVTITNCEKNNKIKSVWVSTFNNTLGSSSGILDIRDNDTLFYTPEFNFAATDTFPYTIQDSVIYINDKEFYGVLEINNNFLRLKKQHETETFMRLLPNSISDSASLKQKLMEVDWQVTDNNKNYRMRFTNKPWNSLNTQLNGLEIIQIQDSVEYSKHEWWILKKYLKRPFLVRSFGGTSFQIYQFIDFDGKMLKAITSWGNGIDTTVFRRINCIKSEKHLCIKKQLTNSWRIDRFKILQNVTKANHDKNYRTGTFYNPKDSVPKIFLNYLKKGKLSYHIEQDEFTIMVDSIPLRKGNWSLSCDGKYILVDSGEFNYHKLIYLDQENLIFQTGMPFYYENPNRFSYFYIKIYLRNVMEP